MQPERPLLTIAIPTYNRSGCLAQLLDGLTPQLEGETRVELLICDNASPDDTSSVAASFRERGLALIYSRNETNIGSDANFIRCYEMAHGEYVWIFEMTTSLLPADCKRSLVALKRVNLTFCTCGRKGLAGDTTACRLRRFRTG